MFGFSPYSAAPFSALANAGVSVALTGVLAAGNVGTVVPSDTEAENGVLASGAVGTVGVSRTIALTGVGAGGDVGSVANGGVTFALTGVGASGNVGGEQGGQSITGVSASGSVGTVVAIYWNTIDDSQNAGWVIINTA